MWWKIPLCGRRCWSCAHERIISQGSDEIWKGITRPSACHLLLLCSGWNVRVAGFQGRRYGFAALAFVQPQPGNTYLCFPSLPLLSWCFHQPPVYNLQGARMSFRERTLDVIQKCAALKVGTAKKRAWRDMKDSMVMLFFPLSFPQWRLSVAVPKTAQQAVYFWSFVIYCSFFFSRRFKPLPSEAVPHTCKFN